MYDFFIRTISSTIFPSADQDTASSMVRGALSFWIFIASFFFCPSRAIHPTAEGTPKDYTFVEKTGRARDQCTQAFTQWAGSVECNFDGLDGVPVTTIIASIQDHHFRLTRGGSLPELTSRSVCKYLDQFSSKEPYRCVRVQSKSNSRIQHYSILLPFSRLSVPSAAKRASEYKKCTVDKRYLDRRIRDTEELLTLKKEIASVEELRAECKQQTTRISNLEQMNTNLQAKLASQGREAKLAAGLRTAQG